MGKYFTHPPLQIFCTTALILLSIEIVKFLFGFAGPVVSQAMRAAGQ